MTTPDVLPAARTTANTRSEHLDDHAALHAFFNAMGGRSLAGNDGGAWSAATAYKRGQIVSKNGKVYQALLGSTGTDPSVPVTDSDVGGNGTFADATVSSAGGPSHVQSFTVGVATRVTGVTIGARVGLLAAGSIVAILANSGTILTQSTAPAINGSTTAEVPLPEITLQPGITYRLRVDSGNVAVDNQAPIKNPTGVVDSIGQITVTQPNAIPANPTGEPSFTLFFRLIGGAGPVWKELTFGAQAAAARRLLDLDKGVWAAGTAYLADEIVTKGGKVYQALLASTGADPTAALNYEYTYKAGVSGSPTQQFGSTVVNFRQFFTPTVDMTIGRVSWTNTGAGAAGTVGITLANDRSTTPAWIGKGAHPATAVGTATATFDVPVLLTAGTAYTLTWAGGSGGLAAIDQPSPGVETLITLQGYADDLTSNIEFTNYSAIFDLIQAVATTPWRELTFGAQAAAAKRLLDLDKGTWVAGTAYLADDLVTKAGKSYQALTASTGSDPATPVFTYTSAASTGGTADTFATVPWRLFFTPTQTIQVRRLSFLTDNSTTLAAGTVGITLGSDRTSPPTYLTSANYPAGTAGSTVTVDFPAEVTLTAGTQYTVAWSNGGTTRLAFKSNPVTVSGLTVNGYSPDLTTGITQTAGSPIFTLFQGVPVWKELSFTGLGGGGVVNRGAFDSGTAYAVNDIVQFDGSSFVFTSAFNPGTAVISGTPGQAYPGPQIRSTGTVTFSNFDKTVFPDFITVGNHSPGVNGSRTAWFYFDAVASGSVQVDTIGSSPGGQGTAADGDGPEQDTHLFIYDTRNGTALNQLTLVTSDDDGGGSGHSRTVFTVQAGRRYVIQAAMHNDVTYTQFYKLNWSLGTTAAGLSSVSFPTASTSVLAAKGSTGATGLAGTIGDRFRGTWAANTAYTPGDVVTEAGSSWLNRIAVNGTVSPTSEIAALGPVTEVGRNDGALQASFGGELHRQGFSINAARQISSITVQAGGAPNPGATSTAVRLLAADGVTVLGTSQPLATYAGGLVQYNFASPVTLTAGTYVLEWGGTEFSTAPSATRILAGAYTFVANGIVTAATTATRFDNGSPLTSTFYLLFRFSGQAALSWSPLSLKGDIGPVGPSAGSDSLALHFKGPWSPAPTYAVQDLVQDPLGLHVALTAVPSGLATPSANPTFIPAALKSSVGDPSQSGGALGAYSVSAPFTTGPAGQVVHKVEIGTVQYGNPFIARVGIATALGTSDFPTSWLGATPEITTIAAGTPTGVRSIPLPAAVTLQPNTTYYMVIQGAGSDGAHPTSVIATSGAVVTGSIASVAQARFVSANGSGGAWQLLADSIRIPFSLVTQGTSPYWTRLGAAPEEVYLQAILAGELAVATDVLPPGLRVPKATTARAVIGRLGTAPTGSSTTFNVERFNNGTSQGLVGTVTFAAGSNVSSVSDLSVPLAKGDILKVNVTAVGSTTPGMDLNVSVDCF